MGKGFGVVICRPELEATANCVAVVATFRSWVLGKMGWVSYWKVVSRPGALYRKEEL